MPKNLLNNYNPALKNKRTDKLMMKKRKQLHRRIAYVVKISVNFRLPLTWILNLMKFIDSGQKTLI